MIHHSAICVRDLEPSLRFWRDGLGFTVLMDERLPAGDFELSGGPSAGEQPAVAGRRT